MKRIIIVVTVFSLLVFLLAQGALCEGFHFDNYWFPGNVGSQWTYIFQGRSIVVSLSYEDIEDFVPCWVVRSDPGVDIFWGDELLFYYYGSSGTVNTYKQGMGADRVFPYFFDTIWSPSERPYLWEVCEADTNFSLIMADISQTGSKASIRYFDQNSDVLYIWDFWENIGPVKIRNLTTEETFFLQSYRIYPLGGGPVKTGSYNVSPGSGKTATAWGAIKK